MALGYQPSLSSQVGLVTLDIVDILCHYRDALISGPLKRGIRGLGGKWRDHARIDAASDIGIDDQLDLLVGFVSAIG